MTHTLTLEVPDSVFQPLQRAAAVARQPVELVCLQALQVGLPALDDLPPEFRPHLEALERLDDEALRRVMPEQLSPPRQQQLSWLLRRNAAGTMTVQEQAELAALQSEADLLMLRKAHAAVLLRFRGQRVPTLAELNELTRTAK